MLEWSTNLRAAMTISAFKLQEQGQNAHYYTRLLELAKMHYHLQVARLSQRDRAAGWVSYGQK